MTAREALKALYLSWVNDFVTVAAFAEYHNITKNHAVLVINMGRDYHGWDAKS